MKRLKQTNDHGATEGMEQDVCLIEGEWVKKSDHEYPKSNIFSVPSVTPW